MEVSQGMRSLIAKNASSNELESQARSEGMESLLEYGRRIVEMGKTSEEEINKLVLEEKA
jgi:type II secretory ATPase GspE/PulE/Tfp pilus assembly ATPase PilB-like protein